MQIQLRIYGSALVLCARCDAVYIICDDGLTESTLFMRDQDPQKVVPHPLRSGD